MDRQDDLLSEANLRRWLTLLRRPDQLAATEITDFLQQHQRLPASTSALAIGQAGAQMLLDAMERLKPPEGAPREQELPFEVLRVCFIEGKKLFQAAHLLGLSERQLSRERTRAIKLLMAELEEMTPAITSAYYQPEPIPSIRGFLPRPGERRKLDKAIETYPFVNVHGPPGIGKTSLVAEYATDVAGASEVFWYRFRGGVNVSLKAVLFEFGEYLSYKGSDDLSRYMSDSLPSVDTALATRLAMKELGTRPQLLAFDDYHLVEDVPPVTSFLEEMTSRYPNVRVVTISRHRYAGHLSGTSIEMGPLARSETEELLANLGVQCSSEMVRSVHSWTRGNPYLLKLAATWLKTATPDSAAHWVDALRDQEEVHRFLLSHLTELVDTDDQAILHGASIFRGRFNDDALAYVTGRTRGAVSDSSMRLVRLYAATRSKTGDSAFFHNTLKDYVYERLDPAERAELHLRAAEWFERTGESAEATFHRKRVDEDRTVLKPAKKGLGRAPIAG